MTRSMLDSITAEDIPASFRGLPTALVAGYVDGPYAWSPADWQLHASRLQVRIATRPATNDGHVLDIEPGNADASATVGWVRMRRASGLATPAVYCFSDAGPAGYRISDVRAAFAAASPSGEPPPLFWIAKWDNDPSTFDPSGDASIVAKQYAGSAQTGGHFDANVVADFWPGVDAVSEYVTLAAFEAYQRDVRDTIEAMKVVINPLVGHIHRTPLTTTGKPEQ